MKRTLLCGLALASLATGASINAFADTGYIVPEVVQRAVDQDRYEHRYDRDQAWQRDHDRYAYERDHDRDWRRCDAPRWDPNQRYFPGQAVRRNGELYVATEASRHVYNVNSPPEWTPNYWAPARCH